jgi:hypothetical protein
MKLNSLNVTAENAEQNATAAAANEAFYEKFGTEYVQIDNAKLFGL